MPTGTYYLVEYRNENTKVILTKIMGGNREEFISTLAQQHSIKESRITIIRII